MWLNRCRMFQPLSLFVGLRYVRSRTRKFFVSFITWASLTGVAVGVAALIVVLSVMNGFEGELRAIGDVLRDQLFYMARVGFNAFATREDRSIEDALKGLSDFSEVYQHSWDQKSPLFRRAARPAAQDA